MQSIDIPNKIKICENAQELEVYLNSFFSSHENENFLFQYSDFGKSIFEKQIKPLLKNIKFKEINSREGVELDENIDWVFSVGAGRTLDISKMSACKSNAKLACLPTMIAHDGICSPVAVIDNKSSGAIVPSALFIDLSIIKNSPIEQIYAGVGDLVANLSAIEDWYLAKEFKAEELDDFAIILSRRAAQSIIAKLEINLENQEQDRKSFLTSSEFLHSYIESLVLSGISMSIAGSSRPCSGAEHLISHAIDEIYGANQKALHGIQVLVATLYLEKLRAKDLLLQTTITDQESKLTNILKAYNMPSSFADIDIEEQALEKILEKAPSTRQNRYTVLDQLNQKKVF